MKVALLCSGLGHVARGHEVFAQGLFDLLADSLDITLLKGGGTPSARQWVVPNVPRNSPVLDHIHVPSSPRWAAAMREQERLRVEHETFGWASLTVLLQGQFDVLHCLEQEVCNVIYPNRHLFQKIPKIVFSNGGAIPAADLPQCDFVQEHTEHNLKFSARHKAFMIPHGVDFEQFRPGMDTQFRRQHGIADDAFVVVSVGTIGVNHKRMDHVIREVAPLDNIHLVILGQESSETPAIKALGQQLLGQRVTFATVPHSALPQALAAADVFVLGSLFETFGIVYIEAMAMGLPVVCTQHINQRQIVKHGVFVDMAKPGKLTAVLRDTPRAAWHALGLKGQAVARQHYDLKVLKASYLRQYLQIAAAPITLPKAQTIDKLRAHGRHAWRALRNTVVGRAQ